MLHILSRLDREQLEGDAVVDGGKDNLDGDVHFNPGVVAVFFLELDQSLLFGALADDEFVFETSGVQGYRHLPHIEGSRNPALV